MEEISFKTMGIRKNSKDEEAINVQCLKDKVLITITKAFPTPGYSISVDKIQETDEGYRIYLDEVPPLMDSIQLQVVTYKTITLEIDKKELKKPGPYRFILDGHDFPSRL